MKLKQIAIAISLFFSCYVAFGAIYDLSDEQPLNFPNTGLTYTPDNEADDPFFELQLSDAQIKNIQIRQDYLETLKLLKNKQFTAAENKINSLIQQNPKEADFYNLQASLEFLKKEHNLAIKSYQKAIKLNPKNLRSHLSLASVFLKSGNLTQAKKYANSALSINDKSPHAYILLAEIAYQEKKPQDAENILLTAQKKIQENSRQEIIIANKLARLYALQNQHQKLSVLGQDIIKRHPDNSSALALLASIQIFNNKTEFATSTLEKLINQEPKDIPHRLALAKLLAKQPKNKQQVLHLLDEISFIAPDNTQVQIQNITLLTQLKFFPEALQATKKVKQLSPNTGLAETLEGEIYLIGKKPDQALAAFQKAYIIKPSAKTLNIIANTLMTQGKQADAINFLNQELKKNPQNLAAHFKLGNIYQQQKKTSEAEKHYQAILAEQPDNVVILNNLAWIYYQQNNPKALLLAKKAYQKAPKSATVADTYAVILVKQGHLAKGLNILEKASKLAPENYDIQYHLANTYALSGQHKHKQAIQILKTIVRSEQDFSEKDAAVSLLKKLK